MIFEGGSHNAVSRAELVASFFQEYRYESKA